MGTMEDPFEKPSPPASAADQSVPGPVTDMPAAAQEGKIKREKMPNGSELLTSPEGKKFVSERITDPESPKVEDIVRLTQMFDPEEADTPEIIRDAIGFEERYYHYILISDEKGEPVCHTQGSYLELEPTQGEESTEAIAFLGFAITRKDQRRQGLATEASRAALQAIEDRAKEAGTRVAATVVEGTAVSEDFWNHMGLRRPYYEDKDGNFHEVPYTCPPISWDPETGKPLDPETGEVGDRDIHAYAAPEHLMISLASGKKETNMGELMPMIDAIYQDNYVMYEDDATEKGMAANLQAIELFKEEMRQAVANSRDGRIHLMSAEERSAEVEKLKAQGKKIHEVVIPTEEDAEYDKF